MHAFLHASPLPSLGISVSLVGKIDNDSPDSSGSGSKDYGTSPSVNIDFFEGMSLFFPGE